MAERRHTKRRRGESDLGDRLMIGATPASIGDDLRAARLARGETVDAIAKHLRIRAAYLEAIEDGVFDSLPGPTYAAGFVRGYARHLGLDAEDMMRRFKEEASGIHPPAELAFPEPVVESRVPRGGLLIIASLLALVAYGGWYYLSTKDLTVATDIPAAPAGLSGGQSAESLAELTPSPRDEPPAELAPEATTPIETAEPAPQAAPTPVPPPIAQSPAAAQPAPALQTGAIPAVPGVTEPAGEAGPRVFGDINMDSRITLQARGDSWIQVRAADESLIATRTLRAGDSYRVPNQPGLRLMTGNAGALDVLVDGQPTPSLGPFGAVRRNIPLDAERLKAGVN